MPDEREGCPPQSRARADEGEGRGNVGARKPALHGEPERPVARGEGGGDLLVGEARALVQELLDPPVAVQEEDAVPARGHGEPAVGEGAPVGDFPALEPARRVGCEGRGGIALVGPKAEALGGDEEPPARSGKEEGDPVVGKLCAAGGRNEPSPENAKSPPGSQR